MKSRIRTRAAVQALGLAVTTLLTAALVNGCAVGSGEAVEDELKQEPGLEQQAGGCCSDGTWSCSSPKGTKTSWIYFSAACGFNPKSAAAHSACQSGCNVTCVDSGFGPC
jgi:hypothetical protein